MTTRVNLPVVIDMKAHAHQGQIYHYPCTGNWQLKSLGLCHGIQVHNPMKENLFYTVHVSDLTLFTNYNLLIPAYFSCSSAQFGIFFREAAGDIW